jgi:hypothetical protein
MRKTIVRLVDDLTGADADETVKFAYEGTAYTIDLSTTNAAKLRKIIAPYADAGARVRAPQRKPSGPTATRAGRAQVRAWARRNGWPNLGERGRIPDDAVEQYIAARRGYPPA